MVSVFPVEPLEQQKSAEFRSAALIGKVCGAGAASVFNVLVIPFTIAGIINGHGFGNALLQVIVTGVAITVGHWFFSGVAAVLKIARQGDR